VPASVSRVVLIGLGGTIATTASKAGGVVPTLSTDDLVAAGLADAEVNLLAGDDDAAAAADPPVNSQRFGCMSPWQ
jgi:L-asparaginase/Glu-tRNA(Gln) amidotransferase subunit D